VRENKATRAASTEMKAPLRRGIVGRLGKKKRGSKEGDSGLLTPKENRKGSEKKAQKGKSDVPKAAPERDRCFPVGGK